MLFHLNIFLKFAYPPYYDYIGCLGLGVHGDWETTDKWICSELVAWGMEKAGYPLFRSDVVKRVTQEDIWKLQPVGKTELY